MSSFWFKRKKDTKVPLVKLIIHSSDMEANLGFSSVKTRADLISRKTGNLGRNLSNASFRTWTMWDRIMETFCKFSPERGEKSAASNRKSSWLNVLCFYIFGTMSFFYQEMLYTASEDILSGRKLPTSVIIVTFVTPLAAIKLIAPWFIQRISYVFKICFIATFMVAGLVLIIFVNDMHLKLVGIGLNALSTGMAEVVFLSLTSFYPQVCISSFVAGTGMASLVSPLYYTGKSEEYLIDIIVSAVLKSHWAKIINSSLR